MLIVYKQHSIDWRYLLCVQTFSSEQSCNVKKLISMMFAVVNDKLEIKWKSN